MRDESWPTLNFTPAAPSAFARRIQPRTSGGNRRCARTYRHGPVRSQWRLWCARFYAKSRELKEDNKGELRALVGSELTLENGSVLPVLVRNRTGYQNLCRLITRAQLRAPKGQSRVQWGELEEFHEGLIALTGDAEGPLHGFVCCGDRGAADEMVRRMVRAFGVGHVYVELQRHRIPDEERIVNGLCELASANNLPIVATNGVAYAEAWGRNVHDIFTCLRHHTHLDAAGALLNANSERRVKSPREMAALFADLPEAITNTQRLAERLEFTLKDLGYQFPNFPVPEGTTMERELIEQTYHGARGRYGWPLAKPVRINSSGNSLSSTGSASPATF